MSETARIAKAKSVHDRLLNLSRAQNRPFDLLANRYVIERLLYRLSHSSHADKFVLKGAMVFVVWGVDLRRPTRDLDLMGFYPPDVEKFVAVFTEIASTVVNEDGLLFNVHGISAEQIREDSVYSGIRVKIPALLGSMRITLQIDVGVGDALVPKPENAEFPALLGDDPPIMKSYSRYLVVAEKYEAMVKLGEANTRMKDFYDIWYMAGNFSFDHAVLKQAITHTFTRRATSLPMARPTALSESFYNSPIKQQQWKAFVTKARMEEQAPDLQSACDTIWKLVG